MRFAHMGGYRETQERRAPLKTKLRRPPSATAVFRSLVTEMKERETNTMIVDVRGNHGGDSFIVDILVYFLYGRERLARLHDFGHGETGVFRYSRRFFADRPEQSLESLNEGRLVPLIEGDYEFSRSFVDGEPIAGRTPPVTEPLVFEYMRTSPTFRPEFEAGEYEGYYHPEKIVVLCDAGTISAGFSVAVAFHQLGGTLVGTPSAQAPNSFGAGTIFELDNTGIRGMVPVIAATHFADDPSKARVLPVDYPLDYERLASYDFDPNAAYLYALELLEGSAER